MCSIGTIGGLPLASSPSVVSSSDHGAAHGILSATPRVHGAGAVLRHRHRHRHRRVAPARRGAADRRRTGTRRRVAPSGRRRGGRDRSSSRSSVYGPGHRGVDFAAAPGTPVRAANDGDRHFAGSVAGTLHVTLAHGTAISARRTRSCSRSRCTRARPVARGDIVGVSGGSDDDHAATVLHFGVRVGDRYVDPMLLFRPDDLTKLVHLVPAADRRRAAVDAGRRAARAPGVVAPSDARPAPRT